MKNDLLGWKLSRCVGVMDRGMNSEENRLILQKAGGHYILGEKLRSNQEVRQEVLAKRGRYLKIRENLKIKEVIIGDRERRRRFILVHNPEEAKKDKATREKILATLEKIPQGVGRPEGESPQEERVRLLGSQIDGQIPETAQKRRDQDRQGKDPRRRTSGREVHPLYQQRHLSPGGHRPGVQAASGSGEGLPYPEDHPGSEADLSSEG